MSEHGNARTVLEQAGLGELAPLAARVCPWSVPDDVVPGLLDEPDHEGDGEDTGAGPDAGSVRAMTLILRIEREGGPVEPPTRTALLEAAAAASLGLCLDERASGVGPWAPAVGAWAGAGRIRKLSRRARTSHWRAAQDVDGLTISRDGADVRALVPGPVDDVPHEIRRLQIGGTDLPADDPGPPPATGPVVWMSPQVRQSTGKAAAQVGHASMILAVVLAATGADPTPVCEAVVRPATAADWARWSAALAHDPSGRAAWETYGVAPVRDAGFTEVAPGTITCMGQVR